MNKFPSSRAVIAYLKPSPQEVRGIKVKPIEFEEVRNDLFDLEETIFAIIAGTGTTRVIIAASAVINFAIAIVVYPVRALGNRWRGRRRQRRWWGRKKWRR